MYTAVNQIHRFLLEFGLSLPRGTALLSLKQVEQELLAAPRDDTKSRRLLVQGARAAMQHTASRTDAVGAWVRALSAPRLSNVVASALANKLARIARRGSHREAENCRPS